ncbi:LAMI_0A03708g1_1 [Lachancea mirantina]|uniref:LAMI_0A03708g1_1 n=1 Tax=Lachancea mirantina TaxID=1230905 RepID=A0A1G4INZ6_9SACH|nr:LAMI_0A03708g1_1 [Lachancea mirantina]
MAKMKIKRAKGPEISVPEPKTKRITIKAKKEEPSSTSGSSLKVKISKPNREHEQTNASPGGAKMKLKLNFKKEESTIESSSTPKAPRFRIKPVRIPGEGYDSEASDVEDDPLVEEGIILRVLPDLQTDFIKSCIESGDFTGLSMKWKGERHAILKVNGYQYGAVLVDLPSNIEVNKSVDRKNLLKTFDVSQMLICVKPVKEEEDVFKLTPPDTEDLVRKHFSEYADEILTFKKMLLKGYGGGPLTDAEAKYSEGIVTKTYDYKHGLTPPLHNVRNRRFRRKLSRQEINHVEKTVELLLKQDEEAEDFSYELVSESEIAHRPATNVEARRETAERGSLDLFGEEPDDHEDLELELEQALQEDKAGARLVDEGANSSVFDTAQTTGETPRLEETGDDVEQDNGEEEEDDEEDEDNEEDMEEEAPIMTTKEVVDESRQHNELLKDELMELEVTLQHNKQRLQKATNPLLKSRFVESIKKLEKEVDIKRKQLKQSNMSTSQLPSDSKQTRQEEDEEEDEEEEEEDLDNEDDNDDEEDEGEPEDEGEGADAEPEADRGPEPDRNALDQEDMDMMVLFGGEGD